MDKLRIRSPTEMRRLAMHGKCYVQNINKKGVLQMKRNQNKYQKNDLLESLQPLKMIELHIPDDWKKEIQNTFRYYKELANKRKNSNHVLDECDFEKDIEKRRIQALLRSIESLPVSKYFWRDWIMMNAYSTSYTYNDKFYHIMTAAAIWILDQISETDAEVTDLYRILPRDKKLLEPLCEFDLCDTQYSQELIASVEYVLRNRNSDIAPLIDGSENDKRVFTSILAAKGECHADVPSRKNFEALIAMIPQERIDSAVTQFEKCFAFFQKRMNTLFSYLNNKVDNKIQSINAMRKKINAERKNALELLNKTSYYTNNSCKKNQKSIPFMTFNMPELQRLTVLEKLIPKNNTLSRSEEDIMKEIDTTLNKISQMEEKLEKLNNEFDDLDGFRFKTQYFLMLKGNISEEEYEQYYSDMDKSILDPLPFTDPFSMCFALLYLIEKDSDIPWLYGSCISMMREVAGALPWMHRKHERMNDKLWEVANDENLNLITPSVSAPVSNKIVAFPDWYSRDYKMKNTNQCYARNLAQILYEETGCLMPRNLHHYDYVNKTLGKYGLRKNKALSMLYCMIALGTKRRQIPALNLDEKFMAKYVDMQDTVADEVNPAELKAEIERLRAECQQLRSSLYSAEKENVDLQKKFAKQQEQFEAERRELADLRDIVFNLDTEDVENSVDETQASFPYTVQKKTVVFGGYDTWLKSIKPLFKGDVRFVMGELNFDKTIVRNAEVIWIQIKGLPHAVVCRFINIARQYNKPIRYFTYTSAIKCAEQLLENDK